MKKVARAFDRLPDARRLAREIRLLRSLSHARVLRLDDCFSVTTADGDDVYLVTRLYDGNLHRVLYGPNGALSRRHVAVVGYQLFAALAHVHAAGVLHRDVKPANVFVDDDCSVALGDFGLAREAAPAAPAARDRACLTDYVATSVQETPRKPGVFGLWRPLSQSDSSRFGSFLDR